MYKDNRLTASIVLYNNDKHQLKNAIDSILKSHLFDFLYVIDNSPKQLKDYIPIDNHIVYIKNEKNLGFGSSHNIAIKKSIDFGSKYHLVFNPDISFDPDIIEVILRYMDKNTSIGLLMPQILYTNGDIQYLPKLLPSPIQLLKRKFTISRNIYEKWNKWYEMRNISNQLILDIPIISGCFSFFRTDVFIKVGMYDERYFMYFEDFDISRRIHKYYKNIYFPVVSAYHEYERGAGKNIKLFFVFIISAMKYFYKWGWIFDKERKLVNELAINKVKIQIKDIQA